MLPKSFTVAVCLFFSFNTFAFDLKDRPLRSIEKGSEVEFHTQFTPSYDVWFQEGKQLTGTSGLDENKPYCAVKVMMVGNLPIEDRKVKITQVEGSYTDYFGENGEGTFRTTLQLESKHGLLASLECVRKSVESFQEATLGDFDQSFGNKVSFGKLILSGKEPRQDFPLTPKQFHAGLHLKVARDFPDVEEDNGPFSWHMQNKEFVTEESLDYDKPYCVISQMDASKGNLLNNGVRLNFGSLSASYTKYFSIDITHGMSTIMDLHGLESEFRMLCSSSTVAPISYTDASNSTWGVMNWVY